MREWCLPVSSWDDWPEDLLVVIPCSKGKRDRRAPAAELYTGSMFALALRAARHVAVDDNHVRVLSARHGLVPLDQELAPYTEEASTWDRVPLRAQAWEQGIADADPVVSLCPSRYWQAVRRVWPRAVNAFAGLPGIGYQRQELRRILDIPADWLQPRGEP